MKILKISTLPADKYSPRVRVYTAETFKVFVYSSKEEPPFIAMQGVTENPSTTRYCANRLLRAMRQATRASA